MHRLALLALAVALTGVVSSGCDSTPVASGVNHAEVALYTNSDYGLSDKLHGHVVLVDSTGDVEAVDTDGLFLGTLGARDGSVFVSDASQEIVVGPDSIRRIDRGVEYDMEWWSGHTSRDRWTLFNVGTRGTDTYYMGVVAHGPDGLALDEVEGDVVGATVCDDQVVLAVGRWDDSVNPKGTALRRLTRQAATVTEVTDERLHLPRRAHVTNLACVDNEVIVIATDDRQTLVGRVVDGERTWSPVLGRRELDAYGAVLGAHGREIYVDDFTNDVRDVRALNVDSLKVRKVMGFASDQRTATVTLFGDELVAWLPGEEPTITWFAAADGTPIRSIPGGAVQKFLQDHDEGVTGGPVLP